MLLSATNRLRASITSAHHASRCHRLYSSQPKRAAWLVFEDGSRFEGKAFGAETAKAGEVVFNTGMVGYSENLTDPSYRGQILTLTYPLVGSYGVPSRGVLDEFGLPTGFESDSIHVQGLVVADYIDEHSHWTSASSLSEWLAEEGVPGISGVDTRAITQKLRDEGFQLGKIEFEGGEKVQFDNPNSRNLIAEVGTSSMLLNEGGDVRILMVDTGMKNNMLRCFMERGAEVKVVPWDYDISQEHYDGLFVSNGPGDPAQAELTVEFLKSAISKPDCKPIFGICMGNQLISRAAGAETYKMRYGNRGQNIPVVNSLDGSCIITPQNHGYAVDASTLGSEWRQLFYNANDGTNEGIIHTTKPIFSAQFHPEARAGPDDAENLFDVWMDMVRKQGVGPWWSGATFPPPPVTTRTTMLPAATLDQSIHSVLIVGSGGLSIGQAGEFDYSGNQAIKALREEGLRVILMNPNIASVQSNTDKGTELQANTVYSVPCTADFVEGVIAKERPDGILISMGGQTALNTGIELADAGVFDKYGVKVLGTSIQSIKWTEDRQLFNDKLSEINEKIAEGYTANNLKEALTMADRIGYPVMIRSAYALGGLGSAICTDPDHLSDMAAKALTMSPQILVERSMLGWKEVEYEVVRDVYDNCVTVCNMENFDPLGVHTGDSIVVAPSQTLSNDEYHMLRRTAINVVRHLKIVGECNIQYAMHPSSKDYCIIEVNPRLSRSSALASKATGYPLAFVAAKLMLGQPLPNLRNSVTKTTTACFEPSLDYVVTKIPRWDLNKFAQVSQEIGSAMKSVGEVMAIGRTFEESMQKAIRMVDGCSGVDGFEKNMCAEWSMEQLQTELVKPTDKRVFAIARVMFDRLLTVDEIHDITKIDKWFLARLQAMTNMHHTLEGLGVGALTSVDVDLMRRAKMLGFCDVQIANRLGTDEDAVRAHRKGLGVLPVVKQIDTQAAEYPANTNYLYMTYNGSKNDVDFTDRGVMVLGCGAYRIGSSVEFDWCAVSAVRTLKQLGQKSIVVNYNPETVSTDYDECDRLYFEELSRERVLDIYEAESSAGVVVSVGGQIPNSLAMHLDGHVKILGTSPTDIDNAEDRDKFSALMDSVGVVQPEWSTLTSLKAALTFSETVGFPVLVRPSYVLSGAAMKVAEDAPQLKEFLEGAAAVSGDHPVVISKFLDGCYEIEMDGVGKDGQVICHALAEHVENAGVHSGDATHVLPPQELTAYQINRCQTIGSKVVDALNITGPFNIQFLVKDGYVGVIECNLRASRSVPFVSKTVGVDFIAVAMKALLDAPQNPKHLLTTDMPLRPTSYLGCKVPMFSFTRLRGADPKLGVEMASTGEVACFGTSKEEAFLKALLATRFRIPEKNILISIQQRYQLDFVHSAFLLQQMGYTLFGTDETHRFLSESGIGCTRVEWPSQVQSGEVTGLCAEQLIRDGKVDLCINLPNESSKMLADNYTIRRTAVDFDVPLLNNFACTKLFVSAVDMHRKKGAGGTQGQLSTLFDYYYSEDTNHQWAQKD